MERNPTKHRPPSSLEFGYNSRRRHIVVLGFSQGGVMAYDQAIRNPEKYIALVALSSWLPEELARSCLATPAHQLLPALIQHGLSDPMIPIDRATSSLRLLRVRAPRAASRTIRR